MSRFLALLIAVATALMMLAAPAFATHQAECAPGGPANGIDVAACAVSYP